MIEKLTFLAVLLAVQGHVVVQSSRQGNLNSYYLYAREEDGFARNPILMPIVKDIEEDANNDPFKLLPQLNANLETIVIVHGHNGDANSTLNPGIKDAFFKRRENSDKGDINVIVVDWSAYTKQSYSVASPAVQSVGTALGQYLKLLIDQERIQIEKLHLIGFNLGAHVVGFAGRTLGGLTARITGLDPSGSGWGSSSPRLSKSDARYVEVIHTDGDGLLSNGIGTSLGHVDIFVNGGGNQPGCVTHACSHNRAYDLFEATLIREQDLMASACSSNLQLSLNLCRGRTVEVGGDELFKPHGTSNVFRVNTGRTFPY